MADTNRKGGEPAGRGLGAMGGGGGRLGASRGLPAEGDAQLHPAETWESGQTRSTDHTGPWLRR